ncbi:hypothetical protein DZC73_10025 [Albitalea terrae]|uniref:Uncharacterized protein n=1 Tax=Piscinibacter terrae TaxID=2496871 RepID=A0A3N7J3N5_9BURK|nr:hypothetical protein DZC73_10025 [Albitalea terrae]
MTFPRSRGCRRRPPWRHTGVPRCRSGHWPAPAHRRWCRKTCTSRRWRPAPLPARPPASAMPRRPAWPHRPSPRVRRRWWTAHAPRTAQPASPRWRRDF